MKVKRFHKLFTFDISVSRRFAVPVFVPFDPDEMIVRCVAFNTQNVNTEAVLNLWVDKLDTTLHTFADHSTACPNTTVTIEKKINGDWNFEIRDMDQDLATNNDGHLSVLIEFVKYV